MKSLDNKIFFNFLKIFIVIIITLTGCRETENLITNGGFEADIKDNIVPGWNYCKNLEKQMVYIEKKDVYFGEQSLAIRIIQSNDPETEAGGKNVLSQKVSISPKKNYVLSLFYKRESSIYGAEVQIQLLDGNDKPIKGALYRKILRSPFWTSVQLSFNSEKAKQAEIRILLDSGGEGRISVGRTLWLDEISLIKLDKTGNLRELKINKNKVTGNIRYNAPTRLYPWIKLKANAPHDIDLIVAGKKHTFRTYTFGKETWVQPILPDLVVAAGKHDVKMTCDNPDVIFQRILFTQNPTWQPTDAPEFIDVKNALDQLNANNIKETAGEIFLHIDGELPPGKWPVTQGIPFPRGELWSIKNLDLISFTKNENKVFQADVLSHWSDGSIRWVALSLQGEKDEKFLLRYNHSNRNIFTPNESVSVKKSNEGFNISTGKLNAFIPVNGSNILGPIKIDGKTIISNTYFTINEIYTSNYNVREVTIEENGPVRSVICLKGTHQNMSGEKILDFTVRWFFHAGSSRIDMEHTFTQKDSIIEMKIESIKLVMDLFDTNVNTVILGENGEIKASMVSGLIKLNSLIAEKEDATLADYPYTICQGEILLKKGQKYPGYFSLAGPGLSICGWIQDFWQKGPCGMTFKPNQISFNLVDKPGTVFYTGMSKTSRATFSFNGEMEAVQAYASEPLLMAEPEWYSNVIATGHRFMPFSKGKYNAYDRSMASSMQKWIDKTEQSAKNVSGAGLLNYGDIVVRYGGVPGTGMNLETALDEGSLVQFLRTGDRNVYNYARIAIDHFLDIDIDHSYVNGGLIWVHRQHNRNAVNAGREGLNGHSWFNGASQFEMLRASRRIYDIADEVGQYYSRNGYDLEPYIRPWRPIAWQIMSLVKAYEITEKIEYLQAAQQSLKVTFHQRDFLIEEWPYMFAVGLRAVRHYYSCTYDPFAKEIYLQILDGFMRLRDRPDDVVNGEWKKPESTVLGNFPNDRSCIFYDEGAWSYLLSGERRHLDKIADDLNWQVALGVDDPTLLCGSADLIKVMSELGIKATEVAAELPWAFMPAEVVSFENGVETFKTGRMNFFIKEDQDKDFIIYLFKSSIFKYTVDYEGFANVLSPSGKKILTKPISNKGLNIYTFNIPKDNEIGMYTLEIEFNNIWQWTMQEVIVSLEKGLNYLTFNPVNGNIALDAIGIAPLGRFPWIEEDLDYIKIFELENGILPDGWKIFLHKAASENKYVRNTDKPNKPLRLPINIEKKGNYRIFLRIWKPKADQVKFQVEGQDEIYKIYQTHDMTGTEFPIWSLNCSLGENSIIKYW